MDTNATLEGAAKDYVDSPRVVEVRSRLKMSRFNRRQERARLREDAREQLRHSVGFYQAGFVEQIMLMWTIAKWVKWILDQVFNEE